MNNSIIILQALLVFTMSPCCNKVVADNYQLNNTSELLFKVPASNLQGAACYGDYLFQFTSQNQSPDVHGVYVINMRDKMVEQFVDLGFNINFHNSNASFGAEYYNKDDLFPLLYVSENYAPNNYYIIHAYRIMLSSENKYSFSIVQSIEMPDMKFLDNIKYPHAFVDNKKRSIWIEGVSADKKKTIYKRFWMPSLSEGEHSILEPPALESVCVNRGNISDQSYLIHGNHSYQIMGFTEDAMLSIINLSDNSVEEIIRFKDYGILKEPEGVFIWNGMLCVTFATGDIYALNSIMLDGL